MVIRPRITLGSRNPHKVEKLRNILTIFDLELKVIPQSVDIVEDGDTYLDNARIKARAAANYGGGIGIATDGGVEIPALPSWQGVLTNRFAGEEASDREKIEALLELTANLHGDERMVFWREAVAVYEGDYELLSFEATDSGARIAASFNPNYTGEGIWQASITEYSQFGGKNFFELTSEERELAESTWTDIEKAVREVLALHFRTITSDK